MTGDKKTYLELLHGEIDAAAEQYATSLHQTVSQEMEAGMLAAAQVFPDVPEEDAVDIVIPAMKWRVHHHLAEANAQAARGWNQVFFDNLNEQYDERGGIEA